MAKNFGQYDDDNPVMTALAKARQEEQKNRSADEILSSAEKSMERKEESLQEEKTQAAEKNGEGESPSEIKKTLMNISIRETTKKEWKMFFLEHDLTMTQGIETAVEFLKSEVGKGSIKLSKGGVTR